MRVWETGETDPKTRRSEWEFLDLEIVQAAHSPSQKGKKYFYTVNSRIVKLSNVHVILKINTLTNISKIFFRN